MNNQKRLFHVGIVMFFLGFVGSVCASPFLNGDFEQPAGLPPHSLAFFSSGSTNLIGWTIGGTGGDLSYLSTGFTSLPPADGNYELGFNGANSAPGTWISQTFDTVASENYTVKFSVGRIGGGGADVSITATVTNEIGTQLALITVQAPVPDTFQENQFTFVASGTNATIRFLDSSADTFGVDVMLDAVSVVGDSDLPVITRQPQSQAANFGTNVTFNVSVYGTPPIRYQWQKDGANIPAATNTSLSFSSIVGTNSGSYTVIATNNFGSATSSVAVLTVRFIDVYGNNQLLTNNQYSYGGSATIKLQSVITNGSLFYTLDGSTPNFTKTPYSSPFVLSNSATVRAVTYSADFTQSGESIPVNVLIVPTYSLTTNTPGGGKILLNPTNGPYASNTVVTITAVASNGWTFLQWLGDASGTNSTNTVTMTRAKTVQAIFGTTLGTTVAGNGSVTMNPSATLFPYGSVVYFSAIPQNGSYFFQWANNGTGTNNPYAFAVTKTNQSVAGLFSTLSGGQLSVVASTSGEGRVTLSPFANTYTNGQSVILTATPNTNQTFLGWAGDASGTENPLNVTVNSSKIITANFTRNSRLGQNISHLATEGNLLTLTGEYGTNYFLQISDDLINWTNLATLINPGGVCQFNDSAATNLPRRFYRAVEAP